MQQPDLRSQPELAQKIARWKAGLADVGRRNPLIKFRSDGSRTLEILVEQPDVLFKHLVEGKKTFYFQPNSASIELAELTQTNAVSPRNILELRTCPTGSEQVKRLKKLQSEARISLEERGVNTLFLAFGTLTWYEKEKPDEALISPLILAPVELKKEPKKDIYRVSVLEEDVVLNPTLVLKLKQACGIELPEAEVIQETGYNHFISQFRQVVRSQSQWEVQESVFLSLFSYAKASLVRDITDKEDRIFAHPILQAIVGDLTAYQANFKESILASSLDTQISPKLTFQILDADSSQQLVIEAAKKGSSFVVQGPPGTAIRFG